MYYSRTSSEMSAWPSSNSITELLGALCDRSLSGVSWKRLSLGGASREAFRRTLRKRAYGALLSKLFQDSSFKPNSTANALANTPAHNKMLMISFDLRVSGCTEAAERLEVLLAQLHEVALSSGLAELDSVLELLVQLAGSVPPPAVSFSRDYMRRERPVLRRPSLGGYLSQEMQRLESRAWALVCEEEWGAFGGAYRTLSLMDAPPGTGLLGLGRRAEVEERFERETRLSLFGALQHSRTSDMDIRLDLPPVPSNAEVTGLTIRVPQCLDQSEDEGFQSASNLTPDSQSEPSPSPEVDIWEALRTFVPGRRRCWENVGCPPGQKEPPYLSEAGREAFDQLYRLWEGEVRNMISSQTPSPLLPLPLDCQTQLVKDLLNVLIGVASTTFPLNEASVQFDVRPDVCVSGTSPESVSRLLGELAQYGTHYLRLSRFSLGTADKKGLVFQAFTGGLRRYLHYYRACVLSTPASLSILTIGFHFRKLGRQLRYLSELCCVDGAAGAKQATFPVGVKLLSYLYNEAQSNCSNENYPVLLSLLKSSCEPYTRFVSDWVYSGVFRDVYKEFMIQVNEDYLSYRDKHFWVQGYTLISRDAEDCVPVFLRYIANDVYVCGKTINLLKICCPQHYIFWSELPVPRIAVTFSLREVEEIERDCAVYRGRMETIAKHSAVSREEQALRTELARQELINQVRESAAKTLESIRGRQVSQRLAEEAKKRERFEELRQQLELDQEWRSAAKRKEQEDDFSFARELRDREQRLQALEEQLERRARMDLIAQYSRLSEEAAKRERRAMWKVQRMRLDDARVTFLQQDQQAIQALLKQYPLGQQRPAQELPQHEQEPHTSEPTMKTLNMKMKPNVGSESIPPPPCPSPPLGPRISSTAVADGLISDEIDIRDFLPKPPHVPNSKAITQALQDIGSDLPQSSGNPAPLLLDSDYDFSPYPHQHLKPHHCPAHPSLTHTEIGKNVSEAQSSVPSAEPRASEYGHPSLSSVPLENSAASGHRSPDVLSQTSLTEAKPAGETQQKNVAANQRQEADEKAGERNLDGEGKEPSACSAHSEPKQATDDTADEAKESEQLAQPPHMTAKETPTELPLTSACSQDSGAQSKNKISISELTSLPPTTFVQGHASDAHIRIGELVSEVTTHLPTPSIHGHASDAHIKIGQLVSEVSITTPSPNVHGHASDAHIRIGEHVSDVTIPTPSPNVHGHASDAHIKIGQLVSEVTAPRPSPNVHGHASDAHIKIGQLVSEVTAPRPSPNVHGHASDAHIKIGELVSEVTTITPSPNVYGHASDAHIKVGEFVSAVVPSRPRWSKHGHSSDSTLKVGCVMPETEPFHFPLPGSSYGHSSDSSLGIGCVVTGSEQSNSHSSANIYGHSSDSTLKVGCIVSGSDPLPSPLPGSAYGHSSDSTLGVGCIVKGTEPLRHPAVPGSTHGHFSDSTLGMGCVVQGFLPGSSYGQALQTRSDLTTEGKDKRESIETQGSTAAPPELLTLDEGLAAWAQGLGLSPGESPEDDYLLKLASQYEAEQYEDSYSLMMSAPDAQLLQQVTRGPNGLPVDASLHCATDSTAVHLSEMMPLPVLMKHSVTTPLITHLSLVNKAVVDYFFVELRVEKHFEALRHFLLMEDGEFALSLTDRLFEKLGSGQTPGELLTPLVLNSILNKAMQYSLHGDSELAANFTFALRYLPEVFHPHAPDSLNCLELRYKVDWPLNIIITDSCMNKYNRLFSFLLQLKHMVWSLSDVWFHLKRTALVKGAGRSVQFRQLQLYRHEMQHFVKVIQGYIANQILQVSWSEFTQKLSSASDLDTIHRTHAEYLNRAIFRALLTEKAAPVMNIIHSIFSLILKFRGQLIAQSWESQQGEMVHPSFIAMQQSYNTFKYYSRFLFKVVSKLVDKGYQPHLEDFLLRINFNNYYKDS
ncbi:gamma-tubulin complex component 6 [Pygocentrus nattereri]|uniref:Gamma-tubulin complex component 6 n=1 Tax=Pygocentrus nattereri TaxID=42514 RepID=A0A3B4DE77_PYGNA|nr:gamma-tubulin complex component 6 [Pygocentrus nattereri]XP_017562239.1 gamma-tubulin complex component 6 [Pygocentrus nattereri]XP_017562240.1 gamma-tubulin complex component 6 [Pygocentrus nattereri]XP_017562241.1 gamma-tubulin complex component 6 [Pygocentrus nattereri]